MRALVRRFLGAVVAVAAFATTTRDAAADELAACNGALVRGQELARAGRLLEARAAYPVCLRATCDAEIRAVCANFVAELTRALPSLRLAARAGPSNVSGVRYFVDDVPVSDPAGVVEVDPGSHRVRAAAAGHTTVEQTVSVGAGGGTREVTFELVPLAASPPAEPSRSGAGARVPLASWVLGGVALVGVGGFTAFALDGKSTERDLRATCPAGPCDSSSMRRSYLVADISLGVGIVSAAAAVILALTSEAPPATHTAAR